MPSDYGEAIKCLLHRFLTDFAPFLYYSCLFWFLFVLVTFFVYSCHYPLIVKLHVDVQAFNHCFVSKTLQNSISIFSIQAPYGLRLSGFVVHLGRLVLSGLLARCIHVFSPNLCFGTHSISISLGNMPDLLCHLLPNVHRSDSFIWVLYRGNCEKLSFPLYCLLCARYQPSMRIYKPRHSARQGSCIEILAI